jgi:hypothetical protein
MLCYRRGKQAGRARLDIEHGKALPVARIPEPQARQVGCDAFIRYVLPTSRRIAKEQPQYLFGR